MKKKNKEQQCSSSEASRKEITSYKPSAYAIFFDKTSLYIIPAKEKNKKDIATEEEKN